MIDDRADGGGDEGRLDQVFAHGEQMLGDGLVADGVGQDGGDIGRPLVQEGIGREEAGLLRRQVGCALDEDTGPAHSEEDGRNDHDHGAQHGADLNEVGQHRGPEPRPQRIQQHAPGDDDDAIQINFSQKREVRLSIITYDIDSEENRLK